MKIFFTLIAVAAMAFAAQATEWTAADGTTTGEYAPVYGYNFETDQHNQMQYPAAELGIPAGTEITAVKFYTSTTDNVNALGGTVTVSLANMNEATPWSVDGYGYISGNLLDVAATAVATVTPAADEDGVWTIIFDAPFTYTGGALLVDVQSVAGEYKSTEFYGKEMGAFYVMTTYGYAGTKKGQTVLPKATFIYEGGEEPEPGIATLAEANALEEAAEFTFGGDAVVTYQYGEYLWLRDASGYGLICGTLDGTFANSQVLSEGWTATKTSENGWVRYTDAAGLSASGETNAELAAPQEITSLDASMLNAYVCIIKAKSHLMQNYIKLEDGTTIPFYNMLGVSMPAGLEMPFGNVKDRNFYGIVGMNDGVLKFIPIWNEFYTEPEPEHLRGDVDKSGEVTIADVTALIDYLLNAVDASQIDVEAANCNGDDNVTIADVTALIDYLLNGTW